MTQKHTVLCIDDDKFIHKVIARTLNPTFDTLFAHTGEEGINLAHMHKPDIIITDVEMPGMNGYEVCEKLKHDPTTLHIPIIFLSSLDSLNERLSGFESGADDYLVKPFDAENLIEKIAALTHYASEKDELQQKIADAEKTAYIALTGSSDLGMAMQLIEHSFKTTSLSELAKSLISYAKNKELDCSLLIKRNNDSICLSTTGTSSPLEKDLVELLSVEQDRFHDFGCRTQINFPNISLLIKNMPLSDPTEYGRIKDAFPPILAAYDAKIKAFNIESVIREQSIKINASFKDIKETLKTLGDSLHENSKSSFTLMSNMLDELNMQLPSMGLEDDQEEYILSKIETAVVSAQKAYSTGENIKESFEMVISQLQDLVEQQNTLLDSSIQNPNENKTNDENSGAMDVELF